ncbi:MAG: lytic polysaccharide monooxygenase [Algicola sp.]|nr:lytic polysaccharide monooxygenase [Algicola sp.]
MKTITTFGVALATALLSLPAQVYAHGYPVSPKARQAICDEQGGFWWPADGSNIPNLACRAAFLATGHYQFTQKPEFAALVADYHNQAAVEAKLTDGTLCAGADKAKAGMNLPSVHWQRTEVSPNANGDIKVKYRANTPHSPSFWRFYLTKPGFDTATETLGWDDLELVQSHQNIDFIKDADGIRFYEMYVAIPSDRSGDAILFSRWQRNDPGGEGFYNCSDITIKQSGTGNGDWLAAGFFVKQGQTAQVGDVARARLFGETGQEIINQTFKVTEANVGNWQQKLAEILVLDHVQDIQIGVKNAQNEIVFDTNNIAVNQVWVHNADHTFNLTVVSQPANTAPHINEIDNLSMTEQAIQNIHVHAFDDENDALTWQWTVPSDFTLGGGGANISLVAPQVTEDTQYTLSVKVSDGQLSSEKSFVVTVTNLAAAAWKNDATYVGGDKVTHQGNTFEAKWWTRGETPGNTLVWRKL